MTKPVYPYPSPMTEATATVGRPTKYDPAMCDMVIALGIDGAGRAEIAAELGICRQTMATWEKQHAEFLDATTRAKDYAAGWWERQGRMGIWSRDFNANAYRLQVMNRFPDDWRDKQEVEHSGEIAGVLKVPIATGADRWSEIARAQQDRLAGPSGNGRALPSGNGNGDGHP